MTNDSIQGMLLGHALGDALGAPHEMAYHKNVPYSGKLEHRPFFITRQRKEGKKWGVLGQFTDDTCMSMCVFKVAEEIQSILEIPKLDRRGYLPVWHYDLKSFMETGKMSEHLGSLVELYRNWANETSAMGKNTRTLLKGLKTNEGYVKRYRKMYISPKKDWKTWTQSNGALMRCAPWSIISSQKDRLEWVVLDGALTNPSPLCILVNIVYVEVIARFCLEKSQKCTKESVLGLVSWDAAKKAAEPWLMMHGSIPMERYQETLEYIQTTVKTLMEDAWEGKTIRNVQSDKGWCLHGLWSAVYALSQLQHDVTSYQQLIDEVVRRGGDTDTNAAITGAVVGAWFGLSSLKSEERTSSNLDVLLASNVNDGDFGYSDAMLQVVHPRNIFPVQKKQKIKV